MLALVSDLTFARAVLVGVALCFITLAAFIATWMTRFPARSAQRLLGASSLVVAIVGIAFGGLLMYRQLGKVRVPTEDPFFNWVFGGQFVAFMVLVLGRAAWLDRRKKGRVSGEERDAL